MKKLFFIYLLIGLTACQNTEKPKDILDKDTYKKIMKDLIIAKKTQEVLKHKDTSIHPVLLVYKTYKVDSIILKKSTDYYSKDPAFFKEIYAEILNELKHKKDSLTKIIDSLHKPGIIQKSRKKKLKSDSIRIKKPIELLKKIGKLKKH